MVRIEVTCDRCRVVIPADRTKLAVEAGPLRTQQAGGGESAIDLCRECAAALSAWLRGGPSPPRSGPAQPHEPG